MNIFILHREPAIAVSMLADCHLRKMCLEHAQILSSLVLLKNPRELPRIEHELHGPKPYNPRHPVIAAVATQAQLGYVLRYNVALHLEYRRRFGKYHAYSTLYYYYQSALVPRTENLDDYRADPDGLCRCFGEFQTAEPDLVLAYREYYKYKKTKIKNWKYTGCLEPAWLR